MKIKPKPTRNETSIKIHKYEKHKWNHKFEDPNFGAIIVSSDLLITERKTKVLYYQNFSKVFFQKYSNDLEY